MQSAFSKYSTQELMTLLDEAEVPCAPINGRADLLVDPQIAANELIVETQHPQVGTVRQTRPAARFDGTPTEMRLHAPTLGEHTDAILAEAGFSSQEIRSFRESNAVA
jgi:formyl-CoA transferase